MSTTKTKPVARQRRPNARPEPVLLQPPVASEPPLPVPRVTVPPVADFAPQTLARLIRVGPGLHVLSLGPTAGPPDTMAGIAFPAIQITAPPSTLFDPVEVITGWNESGAWLGRAGGIVVLRSPPGGGHILITAYAEPGAAPSFPDEIDLRPLDRPAIAALPAQPERIVAPRALAPVPPPSDPREADLLVTLHIARQGDRSFPARGWVGNLGRRLQIEAFSISPRSKLSADDLEYKAFGPQGRETRWTSQASLCGTRGRGLPLTGFAVRALPGIRERFDILYQGAFVDSGISDLCRNGEPCLPAKTDDLLEAINLRVIERDAS